MNLKLKSPFLEMYENFMLSKTTDKARNKSPHWDVFQEDFEKTILKTQIWKTFLRNPLSIGFNDNLRKFGNSRFLENSNFVNGWELRKEHNFKDLIDEKIIDKQTNDQNLKFLHSLFAFCGINFVMENLQSNIGSPMKTEFKIQYPGYEKYYNKKYFCNNHDLSDIYYFFIIDEYLKNLLETDSINVLEIGSGYGGLISKIKRKYKNSRCILIDLPETAVIQTYYLNSEFPNAKFLYLSDLKKYKEKILDIDFDFLILPYWEIEAIPDKLINLIINIRSMMEMTKETITFYFKQINRIICDNGNFVCINRYKKNDIVLKNYPFDLYWKVILSEQSNIQNHIHQLILQRQSSKNAVSIADLLKNFSSH